VSKLRTPQDKKAAGLNHDRRNAYGENAKSSRKNIPKDKQISHQAERRAANQPLARLTNVVGEDEAVATEIEVRSTFHREATKEFPKEPRRSAQSCSDAHRDETLTLTA